MVKIISAAEVHRKLNEILAEAANNHHSFVIEQEGDLLAAIIPYEEFQRWQEMLEDLEDLHDVDEVDRLLRAQPEAFMSLEEFNTRLDEAEAEIRR